MKVTFLIAMVLLGYYPAFCQSLPTIKYHAFSMQVIDDRTGASKGWQNCHLFVQLFVSNNKMDSILIDGPKHLGILIKNQKAAYKVGDKFCDVYSGFDDITAEELEIKWAVFEKEIKKQVSSLTIKYPDLTFALKLSVPK